MKKVMSVILKVIGKIIGAIIIFLGLGTIFGSNDPYYLTGILLLVLGIYILFAETITVWIGGFIEKPEATISNKQRLAFAVILIVTLYAIFNSMFSYSLQDSSPKQSVALLWAIITLVLFAVIYFVYFKFTKIKFEHILEIVLPRKKEIATKRIFIFLIIGLLVVSIVWSITNNEQRNKNLQEAQRMLDEVFPNSIR